MRTSIISKLSNLLLATVLVSLASCGHRGIRGNGIITTESRPLDSFTLIEAEGAIEIEWHPGPPQVTVTVDKNLLRHVSTKIRGSKLQIDTTERISPTRSIKIVASGAAITGVQLNGACRFNGTQIAGEKFYIDSSGATRLDASGKVNELVASMTGASRLTAPALEAKTAELSLTGASRADINVTDSMKVAITGAGKVTYSGNPAHIEKDVTGAGVVTRRN